jgi:glyoxylase I family protein
MIEKNEFVLWHVALSVVSIDKSIDFYERVFGFKCIKRFNIEAIKAEACFLKNEMFVIELFKFDDFNPLPDYSKFQLEDLKTLGVKHFAFKTKDIERAYKYLKDMGVEFATEIKKGGSGLRYFFIKDPNEILVEIIE